MTTNSQLVQPRQYGDAANNDAGLARLAQAQSDDEALEIEVSLLVDTKFPPEETKTETAE